MNKNIEILTDLDSYKTFLTKISSNKFQIEEKERSNWARAANWKEKEDSETLSMVVSKSWKPKEENVDPLMQDEIWIPKWLQYLLDEGNIEYRLEPGINLVNLFTE